MSIVQEYVRQLIETGRRGDAREESFYSALAELIRGVANENGRGEIQVTILPRPTESGNPDFRVWDGTRSIVGYIEAKQPGIDSLDPVEESEQLKRYRDTFPNLILTNFLEFRLYRDGRCVKVARLGGAAGLADIEATGEPEHSEEVIERSSPESAVKSLMVDFVR